MVDEVYEELQVGGEVHQVPENEISPDAQAVNSQPDTGGEEKELPRTPVIVVEQEASTRTLTGQSETNPAPTTGTSSNEDHDAESYHQSSVFGVEADANFSTVDLNASGVSIEQDPQNHAQATANPHSPSHHSIPQNTDYPSPSPRPTSSYSVNASPSPSPRISTASSHRPSLSVYHPGRLSHSRNASMATVTSATSATIAPGLSAVLFVPGLETIANSKEAKKNTLLANAANRAIELCRSNQAQEYPYDIFEPLRLACETQNEKLVLPSLDLIAKLTSHSFFHDDLSFSSSPATTDGRPEGAPPLSDLIAHSVTSCYHESSSPAVALQVVKALLALVLSSSILLHQSSLLKAVRTVYNIFLLSPDITNQTVAQGSLTQMVNHVFGRIDVKRIVKKNRMVNRSLSSVGTSSGPGLEANGVDYQSTDVTVVKVDPETDTEIETERETDAETEHDFQAESHSEQAHSAQNANVETSAGPPSVKPISLTDGLPAEVESDPLQNLDSDEQKVLESHSISTDELFVKDAFLVFRALCKLTMTPLASEAEKDLKSQDMRSKFLSLSLVVGIVQTHTAIFANPQITIPSTSTHDSTPFLQATKQYLCLSLSRNALSPVTQIFDLSVDLFWCLLNGLRAQLKKELELLFNEIFIPILEMRHASVRQKISLMNAYLKLCNDPQALVDLYVNYDCDTATLDNIYERVMGVIARMGQVSYTPFRKAGGSEHEKANAAEAEIKLRRLAITCVVSALQSLVTWSNRAASEERMEEEGRRRTAIYSLNSERAASRNSISSINGNGTAGHEVADEELSRFENARQQKTSLLEGIKRFNFKPKRGIEYLVNQGFIKSGAPADVASFLHETDGLSKAMIGEYLGEGDDYNVAVMHAFVDQLEFSGLEFTEAVRLYLQSFRLPGEAQKIDRFMLKFAERYIAGNSDTVFANADTAYILAFSVIMLNTDAHNKNLKQKRMSKQEFVKNNRGINDGNDLPEDLLNTIYDEIQNNEIKMKDEIEVPAPASPAGLAGTLANVGRDTRREAYVAQSETMAHKTEALFKTLVKQQRRGGKNAQQFHSAFHLQHVKPMFEAVWMPFLAAISGPFHETDDIDFVLLCLEGFKHAIKIAGQFDVELARNAFVSTLAKFTYLSNISEMKPKHVEAIKTLLDVAISDGNNLKTSWKDVLVCVSQLERMQLISSGIDVPDLSGRQANGKKHGVKAKLPTEAVAEEGRSSQVTVAADMVFSLSKNLSGAAIVDFVQALSDISWEEIQSSTASGATTPRMFSLQKLVEISYYNMNRIRLEWSNIWAILGAHFNQVCCHNNPRVSFFALDALRQLSMRFLEKEELAHFRFQKDFLRPFEYTMLNNQNADAREMVLQCLQQMLRARGGNLRSGWRTMFQVFSAASKVLTERIVTYAFEIVTEVYHQAFDLVIKYGALPDFSVCVTAFCRVQKFQKISLQAIDMLRDTVKRIMDSPEYGIAIGKNEQLEDQPPTKSGENNTQHWFPMLFSFYDILMTAEDLEVRRLALDSLFATLSTHGNKFDADFWDVVCKKVLFPIFAVLNSADSVSRFSNQEHMSVWLSTTMVSALRNLVELYTQYFEVLRRSLEGILDLLCACICQENDTLARIGTSCFQQLLENNVYKLTSDDWEKVITAFVRLFHTTTAGQLFDENLRADVVDTPDEKPSQGDSSLITPAPLSASNGTALDRSASRQAPISVTERRRIFKQIIVKCVLQLLLIESTNELLQNDDVYSTIPPEHLLRLMGVLEDSYRFARKFNADKDLRMELWRVGFMKQLPNLLKQESSSAATLVSVLIRMYQDPRSEHKASREGVLERFIPLGTYIIQDFNAIDPETQPRNVTAWTPVVTEILQGMCGLDTEDFTANLKTIYPLVTDMLSREMSSELWATVRSFYIRTGVVQGLMEEAVIV